LLARAIGFALPLFAATSDAGGTLFFILVLLMAPIMVAWIVIAPALFALVALIVFVLNRVGLRPPLQPNQTIVP
jgi:hypothetical protein